MPQVFTFADVAKHTSRGDLYIVLGDSVYDVSSFIEEHPGGEEILLEVGGQDATEGYNEAGHTERAYEILSELVIGKLTRIPGDPTPRALKGSAPVSDGDSIKKPRKITQDATGSGSAGFMMVMALLVIGLLTAAAYQYFWSNGGLQPCQHPGRN